MPNCRVEVRILPLQQKKAAYWLLFSFKGLSWYLHNYNFSMVPKSNSQEKPKRSLLRKKWLKLFGILVLSILTLEFLLYFGSNLLLKEQFRKRLTTSFNGVYELDFNRVHLSLLRRGVYLDGIVMKPLHPENANLGQVLFELELAEISFSGLWYGFRDRVLTVGEINVQRPNFQLVTALISSGSVRAASLPFEEESPLSLLENELKKSIQQLPISGLEVGKLVVEEAQVFFLNFLSNQELLAKKASLSAMDLHWFANQSWKTPFNARGFEFYLEDVSYLLPDGIHRITSKEMKLSSLKETIDFHEFKLIPDLNQSSSGSYYSITLEKIQLQQVNWNEVFRTSTLELEELVLHAPSIRLIQSTSLPNTTSIQDGLNGFIKGKLTGFSIKELAIVDGDFLKMIKEDTLRNRIQLEHLDLKMTDFFLGEDPLQSKDQIFYGSNASLEIGFAQLFLGDGIHVLSGHNLGASTFKNELVGTAINLKPSEAKQKLSKDQQLYQVGVSEFLFKNIDLKKWYRQGDVVVDSLFVKNPQFLLNEAKFTTNGEEPSPTALLSGIVNELAIKHVQLDKGTVNLKDDTGATSTKLDLGQFTLILEEFNHQPDASLSLQDQVKFDHIFLTIEDYRLKLKDTIHEFFADKLSINSKKELLEIVNLSVRPADPLHVQQQLQALGKSSLINITVPQFRAEGIGVKDAVYGKKLLLDQLQLDEPIFQWNTFRSKESKPSENVLRSEEDLKNLLLSYFEEISVDSVSISDAKIRYENKGKDAVSKFEEDQLFFNLKNFSLQKNDSLNDTRSFFSDEVDLTFNSYSFSLAEGKYVVDTDYLNYNSRSRTIDFENLRLVPGKLRDQRLALGFNFPKVALQGVNLEEFIFDNELRLEKLTINGGEISLGVDRQIQATPKAIQRKRNLALERTIERIHIDTISTSDATLLLNYFNQNQSKKAIKTGFGLTILQFDLDSLRIKSQDLSKTYQGVNLGLNKFEFALPDSVHLLNFEAFAFGEDQEELVFSGLSIQPKNRIGSRGKPVLAGNIERVVLKKNSLLDILTSRTLALNEIRLENPVFSIYLDDKMEEILPLPKNSSSPTSALIRSILLENLDVIDGKLNFFIKGGQAIPNLSFPRVDARIEKLGIDLLDMERFPTWREVLPKAQSIQLNDYLAYNKDSAYLFKVDSLLWKDNAINLKGIRVAPVAGIYGYLNSLLYQQEAFQAAIKGVEIAGIELEKLVQNGLFNGEMLRIDGAKLTVFRDKRKPLDALAFKPLPQYLMENAPVNLDLTSLQVRDSQVQYWEFGKRSYLPGHIQFNTIQLDASPFSLRKSGETYPHSSFRIGIKGQVSDSSQLSLSSRLYFQKGYPMDVNVKLTRFAFKEAEDLLAKTAFVKPLGGEVPQGSWEFRLTDQLAKGNMALGYTGLKLQFLDSLTLAPGKGKLKLYTMMANILVRNSNPGVGVSTLRNKEIFYLRDTTKSMINAWWKATYVGVKHSIGLGLPKAPKNFRKEEEN